MEHNEGIIKKKYQNSNGAYFFCDESNREIERAFDRYECNREKFEFIFGLAESQVVIETHE